jgi:hypothetical protein
MDLLTPEEAARPHTYILECLGNGQSQRKRLLSSSINCTNKARIKGTSRMARHAFAQQKLWGKWIEADWSTLGIWIAARDEFWRPQDEDKWRIINMIPHISLAWWLVGALAIVIVWIFEASFRVTEKLKGDFSDGVRRNIDLKMRELSSAAKSELYNLSNGSIGLHQLSNEVEKELGMLL